MTDNVVSLAAARSTRPGGPTKSPVPTDYHFSLQSGIAYRCETCQVFVPKSDKLDSRHVGHKLLPVASQHDNEMATMQRLQELG